MEGYRLVHSQSVRRFPVQMMCEREEIVAGYKTHWKVDELTNRQTNQLYIQER